MSMTVHGPKSLGLGIVKMDSGVRKLGVRGISVFQKGRHGCCRYCGHRLPLRFETNILCLDGLPTPTAYFALSCIAHSQRMHEIEVDVRADRALD